jgi:hypothetical protein
MGPVFQAHPIPQNVTNFEFHLVGDMTLKQFGYLALGLGVAFITFIGLASPFPFVAYPIILISAATGAAFAFVPIQERPLDHWVAAFFKAIFQPTKLTYQSKILKKEDPFFSKRLALYIKNKHADQSQKHFQTQPLSTLSQNIAPSAQAANKSQATGNRKPSMADRLLSGVTQTNPSAVSQTSQVASPTQTNLTPLGSIPASPVVKEPPKPADLKKTVDLAKEAQETQSKILKIEKQLEQIKATVAQPGTDTKFYIDQFQSLLTDLQKLNEHASGTAHDLAVLANVPAPAPTAQPAVTTTSSVAPAQETTAPLPAPNPPKNIPSVTLTTFPNVINGVVTDSQGNYVEGAIVVAHDKQGLPVRALRSNKLGQFVAATPLSNGVYTIVVEKDALVFDKVAIELKNELLPPILVAAKKQIPVA